MLEAIDRMCGSTRFLVSAPRNPHREPSFRVASMKPAELVVAQRVAERMDDGASLQAIGRHLPELLQTDGELFRLTPPAKLKTPQQLLRQVATDAVAEDRDPGVDVDTRFEPGLVLPASADAAIAVPNANDAAHST